jgi:type III secretory pathway component EscU
MSEVNELIAKFAGTDLATNTLGASVTIFGIYTLYIFLAVAIFVTLLFPAIQMFKDFKTALGAIAGVAVLLLLFILCYWLSVAEPFTVDTGNGPVITSAETMRAVEACIYMLYFMLAAAVLSVIFAPVVSYLKK